MHRQLLAVRQQLGLRLNHKAADYADIHRALLQGALSLVARHDERGAYLGARHLKLRIFPGSCLAGRTPEWIMAAEVSETQRVYARNGAAIESRWLETAASHLLRRTYSDPHWSAKRGEAMVFETVLLYGLKIVERRPVRYAPIEPAAARQLLIRDGLVNGGQAVSLPFQEHNQRLAAAVLELEEKGRRRDLLATEDSQCAFYEERLPPNINSFESLRSWLKADGDKADRALRMSPSDLLRHDANLSADDYPAFLELNGAKLRLHYRFAPGEADDGVNLDAPIGALQAIRQEALDWSVPGFLPMLVEASLRSLPKALRRQLAPIAQAAEPIASALAQPDCYRQGALHTALARLLQRRFDVQVPPSAWQRAQLPPHLLMNVRVIDLRGALLAQGRNVADLQRRFLDQTRARVDQRAVMSHERTGLRDFPVRGVPTEKTMGSGVGAMVGYPALVDRGETVDLRICATRREQAEANRTGYPRLAWLALGKPRHFFRRQLLKDSALGAHAAFFGDRDQLAQAIMVCAAWRCYFAGRSLPASKPAFDELLKAQRPQLAEVLNQTAGQLRRTLDARAALMRRIGRMESPVFRAAREDVAAQLEALTPPDLLLRTPSERLPDLARFIEAAEHRLENLQGHVQRDTAHMAQIKAFQTRLDRLKQAADDQPDPEAGDQWTKLRFDLEELRVALFAQRLARRGATSTKKMERRLIEAEREVGLR